MYAALSSGRTVKAMMMMKAPVMVPALPTSAIARPAMMIGLFGAAPVMRFPISKMATARTKVLLRGKNL